jgi:hypothetical protein
LILVFWPKTISFHVVLHIKATKTLWFAKKKQLKSVFFSHFGSFWVILRSFWAQSVQFAHFSVFFSKFEIFKDFLNNKISI